MKTELEKIHKIMGIVIELYEMDPEYFKDCFFNMYYQMKKKNIVDEKSYGDDDLKKRIHSALNYVGVLTKGKKAQEAREPVDIGTAFNIAYRSNKLDKDLWIQVTNACRAFKSAKKTKFKDI